MLRDRIVCGINNGKIQQRLLAEKTLTLAKTIELAQGMETAAKNAKELSQQEAPSRYFIKFWECAPSDASHTWERHL